MVVANFLAINVSTPFSSCFTKLIPYGHRLATVPAHRPLITDVVEENGQMQMKPTAFDEHEPP